MTVMTEATLDIDVLRGWIGRQRSVTDVIRPEPVARMRATLDQPGAAPRDGEPLPHAWHWLFFLDAAPLQMLDRDGHAARGEFLPPVALPRRMWAGGRLRFIEPIRIGESIHKQSTIKDIVRKTGRAGELCFVTVRHEFRCRSTLKMTEEHDIVYRQDHDKNAPTPTPPAASESADARAQITPTPVMLFRYSALTFNSHRIHYDVEYCREVEGFPGLVVHGPLTATFLAGLAGEHCDKAAPGGFALAEFALAEFEFRAVSPLFGNQPFTIAVKKHAGQLQLWAANARGELAMSATASS